MEYQKIQIKVKSTTDKITIHPLACLHLTNKGCNTTKLRRDIEHIRDTPNTYWIGLGDYAEYIHYLDKRFDPANTSPDITVNDMAYWGERTNREVLRYLEPIADKCLGVHKGNHELTFEKRYGWSPSEHLAHTLKVKHLGYESLTVMQVTDNSGRHYSRVIYATHGSGGGKKPGSHINNLSDLMTGYEADIYIMAHNHRLITTKLRRKYITVRGNPQDRDIVFLTSGTYLDTKQNGIEGYEVKKGFMPLPIGCSHVDIFTVGEHHRVEMEPGI